MSLSSPTRILNALRIGGFEGSYYPLAGKELAPCRLLGNAASATKPLLTRRNQEPCQHRDDGPGLPA